MNKINENNKKLIPLTLEKAKQLEYGDIIYEISDKCKEKKWRVTGKVKRWKRDENRIKIPIKHGLYNYGYIENHNLKYCYIKG